MIDWLLYIAEAWLGVDAGTDDGLYGMAVTPVSKKYYMAYSVYGENASLQKLLPIGDGGRAWLLCSVLFLYS